MKSEHQLLLKASQPDYRKNWKKNVTSELIKDTRNKTKTWDIHLVETFEMVALKKVRLENGNKGFQIMAVREFKIVRQLIHRILSSWLQPVSSEK